MWVQVPSSAVERKQSRSKDLLFFSFYAEESLEPRVQGLLATEWLRSKNKDFVEIKKVKDEECGIETTYITIRKNM